MGSKLGHRGRPRYISFSEDADDDLAEDIDIIEQIETWMKQRKLDYTIMDHRRKFLMEFLNEEKETERNEVKKRKNKTKSPIYDRMSSLGDNEKEEEYGKLMIPPNTPPILPRRRSNKRNNKAFMLETQIEMQRIKISKLDDDDEVEDSESETDTERRILKKNQVYHVPDSMDNAIWRAAESIMDDYTFDPEDDIDIENLVADIAGQMQE